MSLSCRPADGQLVLFKRDITRLLRTIRQFELRDVSLPRHDVANENEPKNFVGVLEELASDLLTHERDREAEALRVAIDQCLDDKFHGGLGLSPGAAFTDEMRQAVVFQVEVWLESLNSEDRARKPLQPLPSRPDGRGPMTLSQKILAHHAIGNTAGALAVGDLVRVSIDWVISSELAWAVSRPR